MPTIQLEADLSSDQLLKAAEQLNSQELEQFVQQLLALRAKQQTQNLPVSESELLLKINRGIPVDIQYRYDELIGKRDANMLTADEYSELLHLTDDIEKLNAERIEYLAALARLRGVSLTTVMQQLGIQPPSYA